MKAFLFFIMAMVACHASVASSSELLKSLLKEIEDRECKADGLFCKNCREIQYCSSGTSQFSVKCADQNSLKPFCDSETNTCTSTETCTSSESTFKCPKGGIGLYPDLLNCSKYHYCNGIDVKPAGSGECPRGSVYDQKKEFCNQYGSCRTYSSNTGCKLNINKFVSYPPSPNLYVLCKADDAILLECPAKNLEFDVSSVSCIFKCRAQGRFPYLNDKSKFYLCVYIGNSYVQQVEKCPTDTYFPDNIEDGSGKCVQC